MADIVSKWKRKQMMAGIRSRDTLPEMIIRRGLHALGYRYRLHDGSMPGKPDLVFPKYRAVLMVNGCFWHMHQCHLFRWPSSRQSFWRKKIQDNHERDINNLNLLRASGWRTAVIWECALKGKYRRDPDCIIDTIEHWLTGSDQEIIISGA
jgi:DNA mismatch endonuclease, patch repair protein